MFLPLLLAQEEGGVTDADIGKPVVVVCVGCGKEFVLRVVVAAYQVQVAGFV